MSERSLIVVKPDSVVESYEDRSKTFKSAPVRMVLAAGGDGYEQGHLDWKSSLKKRSIE